MSISSENVLVLYRNGDADSLTFAQAYQSLHNLSDSQLFGLDCSANEILADYATFQAEVEDQVLGAINDGYNDFTVIVVGYGVPGGFYDDYDVIATTSRLSRINFAYSKQTGNPLYNRQVYSAYSDVDAAQSLICSRIDAPTIATALAFIDSTKKVIRQKQVNGKFYFDPYAVLSGPDDTAYSSELLDFSARVLPVLNTSTFQTVFWDEYTDVVVPRLEQDSFMWAWRANRAGYTFFESTNTARIFLYNADSDDAGEMRNAQDKRFPMLALSSGYAASAGAMSEPTSAGHLRPTPFFTALFNGASIGEAFIFACPFLDWTVSLVGDPLVSVNFPTGTALSDGTSPLVIWEEMHDHLASSLAYMLRRETDLQTTVDAVQGIAALEEAELFPLWYAAYIGYVNQWRSQMAPLVKSFVSFSVNSTSQFAFDTYLSTNALQVSALFALTTNTYIAASSNTIPEGYWQVQVPIVNDPTRFSNYQFQLDIATDVNFTEILYSLDSNINTSNWYYESSSGVFTSLPTAGVTSSYAGRMVRYASPPAQYMERTSIYFYRIRQQDDRGVFTPYVTAQSVVFS